MRLVLYSIQIVLVLLGCTKPEPEKLNYKMITYNLNDDCELYVMHFNDNNLYERIALSGPCKSLNSKGFIDAVLLHLDSIKFDTVKVDGKLIFQFYEFEDSVDMTQQIVSLFPNSELVSGSETSATLKLKSLE